MKDVLLLTKILFKSSLNRNSSIIDDISNDFPDLTITQIRQALGSFLFSGEEVFKQIGVLSGGEKVRLQLLKVFKKQANLLLLDEPTNHMDIVGKESLENILKEYEGTLIFVSHDRYFVNKIANCILAFEPEGVIYFNGNYEEYMRYKENKLEGNSEKQIENVHKPKNIDNEYLRNKERISRKNKAARARN